MSGVYNPTLKETAKVFAKSKDTLSLFLAAAPSRGAGAQGQGADHYHPAHRGYFRRLVHQGDAEEVMRRSKTRLRRVRKRPSPTMALAIFRNRQGTWRNVAALTYTLAGYALGVALLTVQHWALNLAGVLLTGHTLVYAAYFIHEFAHQTVFRSPEANNRWGTLMSWIAGSCHAPFSALRPSICAITRPRRCAHASTTRSS